MKYKVKTVLISLLAVFTLAFGANVISAPSYANASSTSNSIINGANSAQDKDSQPSSLPNILKKIVNVALYLIGAISVLMLIYGGIRYTISAGNSDAVNKAKDTIMYAIIGIVIAILAYAIVNFVISNLTQS